VAFVKFAVGVKPGLSKNEALELAEILSRRRSIAAHRAAGAIQRAAEREGAQDAGAVAAEPELELDDDALQEIATVLAEPRNGGELPRFERLREEIKRTRSFG
jgi:hypothetical protein